MKQCWLHINKYFLCEDEMIPQNAELRANADHRALAKMVAKARPVPQKRLQRHVPCPRRNGCRTCTTKDCWSWHSLGPESTQEHPAADRGGNAAQPWQAGSHGGSRRSPAHARTGSAQDAPACEPQTLSIKKCTQPVAAHPQDPARYCRWKIRTLMRAPSSHATRCSCAHRSQRSCAPCQQRAPRCP